LQKFLHFQRFIVHRRAEKPHRISRFWTKFRFWPLFCYAANMMKNPASTFKLRALGTFAALGCAALGMSACNELQSAPTSVAPPPKVSVVTIAASPKPFMRELPGRIAPTRVAEVRARVAGIVMERTFEQGKDVKAGDTLYRIDPAKFQVELAAAEAALAKALAALDQAEQQSKRVEKLVGLQSASPAQFEAALAGYRQAQAEVAVRKAEIERAKLELSYTEVKSPISGRIGRAMVTEGALVGQGEATHLATVRQLDPIYADFTQSVSELNQLRRAFESGDLQQVAPDAVRVELVLDDGTVYPYPGKLLFSDANVDPSTGQVTLRGEFPNPKSELLPGMYVRVQIEQGIDGDALTVPQQAVQRNDAGGSEVFVVKPDNRTVLQPTRVGRAIEQEWLVLEGLKQGDRVVVEGFQKFVAGDVVDPVPWLKMKEAETGSNQRRADAAISQNATR
jgi:membrane fusion protein, multidrug efflux system